jgi:hypothetical protein
MYRGGHLKNFSLQSSNIADKRIGCGSVDKKKVADRTCTFNQPLKTIWVQILEPR